MMGKLVYWMNYKLIHEVSYEPSQYMDKKSSYHVVNYKLIHEVSYEPCQYMDKKNVHDLPSFLFGIEPLPDRIVGLTV